MIMITRTRAAAVFVALAWGCHHNDGPPCGSADPVPAKPPPSAPDGALGPGFTDLNLVSDGDPAFKLDMQSGNEPPQTTVLIGDLDEDGRPELIFGNRFPQVVTYDPGSRTLGARRPLTAGGQAILGLLGLLDLDGDGHLDLLLGDEPTLNGILDPAQRTQQVAWGRGDGTFDLALLWTNGNAYRARVAALADIDGDGWLDLLIGPGDCDHACQGFMPVLRTGPRQFEAHPEWMDPALSASANALMAFELRPGELTVVVLGPCTGPCLTHPPPAFFHEETLNGTPRFAGVDATPSCFGSTSGLPAGEQLMKAAPMAAAWADLNGDGRLDLAITTDPATVFFETPASGSEIDRTPQVPLATMTSAPGKYPLLPWAIALIDFDGDGAIDLLQTHGNDSGDVQRLGPQFATLAMGHGDFQFADATRAAHLGQVGQWRALTVTDLDGDGDADIAVGGLGSVPHLYRNDIALGYGRIALRLHGTTSNHLGVGARVWLRLRADGPEQLLVPANLSSPRVLSDPLVFAGVGDVATVDRVRIDWPSGYEQILTAVAPNRLYDIVEPPTVVIEPTTRHQPAANPFSVRVTPRASDGTIRMSARVSVAVTGVGSVGAATQDSQGAWSAAVASSGSGGVAEVRVTIDGVPVNLRPRLRWDN